MKNYKISNMAVLMKELLKGEYFDKFLVDSIKITTFAGFEISGLLHRDFYKGCDRIEADSDFIQYEAVKNICFEVIRGKIMPLSFSFILYLPDDKKNEIMSKDENVGNYVLNLKYNGELLNVISAVSYRSFALDRDGEKAWDKLLPELLGEIGIKLEEIL